MDQGGESGNVIAAHRGAFDGPGEMRKRCREFDWASTPLGASSEWPQPLRTIVSIMLDSQHPMFLWWGPDLIQIFNDGYLPSFGTSGRDRIALGAFGREHWSEIWPVIGPQIEGVMSRGDSTWHEDQLVPIERNGKLEDVWWTYGYSPVRDEGGKVAGVLVVVQETTSRVLGLAERDSLLLAEQTARAAADAAHSQLLSVFAQAPVGIAVLEGRELLYRVANKNYQKLIGDRDPIGKTLTGMFPELSGSEIEGILHSAHDTGKPFVATDLLIRFNSQGEGEIDNFYDLVYQPIENPNGSRGIVVVTIDVTERHNDAIEREKLFNMAEQARAEAESANRAKGDFLAVMSHELRTPLNAIGGYAELIEIGVHGTVTPDQSKALSRIQQSQRHLLGLINGVLNYSRVDAGAVEYVIEDVRVGEVLSTCEALLAPQMRAQGLSFQYTIADEQSSARADREKLQQVVLNLLSNAVKFTEHGGSVEMSCANEGADRVAIRVADTGCGIPADDIEHVFQPFVQLDAKLTRTHDGTGLGLSISRNLARGMGGDLLLEKSSTKGSVFALLLPRAVSVT